MLPEPAEGAKIAFYYESRFDDLDLSFVKDPDVKTAAELLTGAELGTGEGQYSPEQTRRALWEFFKQECDDLQENLIARFLDWKDPRRRSRWLGEPEIREDPK